MQNYQYLIIPIVTLIISQLIKLIVETIKEKKFNFKRFLNGYGGMPSTHSALTSSLATIIGINIGFDSPLFAITTIFTFIVIVDAVGVRLESEKQAEAINDISKQINKNNKFKIFNLKEQIGHEPLEVFAGVILGIISAAIFSIIL
ncbi:MAG: divergent PAP2 family protein [Mycoplasmatota bacterium]